MYQSTLIGDDRKILPVPMKAKPSHFSFLGFQALRSSSPRASRKPFPLHRVHPQNNLEVSNQPLGVFEYLVTAPAIISLMGHQLYVFVMINLDTRELVFINVTCYPDLGWVKQQFRNTFFDVDYYPILKSISKR